MFGIVHGIAIAACLTALWLLRENERLSKSIREMKQYNLREATYQRGTATVHVRCLCVYNHKGIDNAIVVDISKPDDKSGAVYSIPMRRLAWLDETANDVHM